MVESILYNPFADLDSDRSVRELVGLLVACTCPSAEGIASGGPFEAAETDLLCSLVGYLRCRRDARPEAQSLSTVRRMLRETSVRDGAVEPLDSAILRGPGSLAADAVRPGAPQAPCASSVVSWYERFRAYSCGDPAALSSVVASCAARVEPFAVLDVLDFSFVARARAEGAIA